MTSRPRILILSFSPIAGDARVLKQVTRFAEDYDVVTCGYGPAPAGVIDHVRVPDDLPAWRYPRWALIARKYTHAYWANRAIAFARNALQGRAFDVVFANDVDSVGLALALRPRCGVHADLHEYAPSQQEENWRFRWFVGPFVEWLCRRFVARADAWSTVSSGLVDAYEREFGFRAELVTNAAPFAALLPGAVSGRLRLVHSGACLRNRNLLLMAEAVEAADADVSLDFYLTPNHPDYLEELKAFARSGSGRVRVHDPVPYERLVGVLNAYDVGLFVLPPVTFNYRWALPNKVFDFVQARLGMVVGPSPEMARFVTEHGLGEVTADFTVDAVRRTIEGLTVEKVRAWKAAADTLAEPLSGEHQTQHWIRSVEALLDKAS
jgi:hypothetical protein